MLYAIWEPTQYRPTRDADLLVVGDSTAEAITRMFSAVCTVPVEPDGLDFDPSRISIAEIREDEQYGGKRVGLITRLGDAVIPVQVDVAFGDAVTPPAQMADLPTILPSPAPRLRIYPRETVVAENPHAIVVLGMANGRLKDYYDLWYLSQTTRFDAVVLCSAIQATFDRRATALPSSVPVGLTAEFSRDDGRAVQWQAFLARHGLRPGERGRHLATVTNDLATFLLPCLSRLAGSADGASRWPPGGPWPTV